MHSHRFFVAVIAALVAALAGGSSVAHAGGDERAPSPTGRTGSASAWHAIAYDDALTTAKCVGDLRTPVCAVETVYGCFIRGGDLCRRAIKVAELAESFAVENRSNRIIRYKVRRIRVARADEPLFQPTPDKNGEDTALWSLPGDVIVTVHRRMCQLPGPMCERGRPLTQHFLVRREDGLWRMIIGTAELLD